MHGDILSSTRDRDLVYLISTFFYAALRLPLVAGDGTDTSHLRGSYNPRVIADLNFIYLLADGSAECASHEEGRAHHERC